VIEIPDPDGQGVYTIVSRKHESVAETDHCKPNPALVFYRNHDGTVPVSGALFPYIQGERYQIGHRSYGAQLNFQAYCTAAWGGKHPDMDGFVATVIAACQCSTASLKRMVCGQIMRSSRNGKLDRF
jgi:hypothetical protein